MATEKINYDFMGNYPAETKEYIAKAIEIYDCLYDKSLKVKENHTFSIFKKALTPNDLRVMSLFIAGLMLDGGIKEIMKISDIDISKCEKFLGTKIISNNYLTEEDYQDYFPLFQALLDNLFMPKTKSRSIPEELFENLFYPNRSNSKVVILFYNFLKKDYIGDSSRSRLETLKKQKLHERLDQVLDNNFHDKIANKSKKEKESLLSKYGTFLTSEQFFTNPAIGREKELQKLMITLLTENVSPLLVGEPGVGKTAIVEGFAYLIQQGLVPDSLKNKKIVSIETSNLLAGTIYRGEFEERISKIVKELEQNPDIILYIDEFHTIIGAGQTSNSNLDFANILKPYLSRGKIKIIGSTTNFEYEEYVKEDKAFDDRFQPIEVKEPDLIHLKEIVLGTVNKFQSLTGISFLENDVIANEVIDLLISSTTKDSRSYQTSKSNPKLIIAILDYVYAYAKSYNHSKVLISDIIEAVTNFNFLSHRAKEYLINIFKTRYCRIDEQEEIGSSKIIQFSSRFKR